MSPVPPVRREVLVQASTDKAFEIFTARIGDWWPVVAHSVHGEGGTVAFEDGRLVERAAGGEVCLWGTVTRWEPPALVAFSWHPGEPDGPQTHVTVSFTASGEQTLVRLEHSGWEVLADPAATRAVYDEGWPEVLAAYQQRAGEPDEVSWVALMHRPGPAAPGGSLFEDPRFGEHVAFLTRMLKRGYLVAAGPLADADGEGMTVLRLPGPGALAEATRLATEDDQSVVCGFLAVTVRPWQVLLPG
jgi:uncharacterized protein YndB with AHSA1/START domain/uncharacterized protein YciI